MTQLSPMVTPGQTMTPPPSHTLSPIAGRSAASREQARGVGSRGGPAWSSWTRSMIRQCAPILDSYVEGHEPVVDEGVPSPTAMLSRSPRAPAAAGALSPSPGIAGAQQVPAVPASAKARSKRWRPCGRGRRSWRCRGRRQLVTGEHALAVGALVAHLAKWPPGSAGWGLTIPSSLAAARHACRPVRADPPERRSSLFRVGSTRHGRPQRLRQASRGLELTQQGGSAQAPLHRVPSQSLAKVTRGVQIA